MDESGRKLVAPRTGSVYVNRVDGKAVDDELVIIAAWQSTEPKAPKRCVVRCDGKLASEVDNDDAPGFPCAVLRVDYSIGGLSKRVLIDAINQSALVLWAESIEVLADWDTRRIARIAAYDRNPCKRQLLAAAINSDANIGDQGPADARWLDALAVDQAGTEDPAVPEWSIHPVPEGARGVRFLNALAAGANVETANAAPFIVFSALQFASYPTGIVETVINGLTDQSIIIVPPGSRYLFIAFPSGTIAGFDEPAWIEWIMSPNTLPGF